MSFEVLKKILIENWPMFVRGAYITLLISITSTIIGAILGLIIGMVRTIPRPEKRSKRMLLKVVNGLISAYIEFFRGTPMMVQSMVIYFGVAGYLE